ncbi:hypothetical protein HDE_09422 [Halotydeus destructor]|nr:hypothetical protein HDE_09422 [Halotydeus destructor]
MDLDDLSLYQELKHFYPAIGPVVNSTRKLYKRVLAQAINEGPKATINEAFQIAQDTSSKRSSLNNSRDVTYDDVGSIHHPDLIVEQSVDEVAYDTDTDVEPTEITEAVVEEFSSKRGATRTITTRLIAVETEPDNFFWYTFTVGVIVVLMAVGGVYLFQAVSDY